MNKAALFSLSALVAIACAAPTTTDPVQYGDGDGDNNTGTGGTTTGTGGAVVVASGGAVVGSTGGTTAGTGGVVANTGGTLGGTGGSVVGGTGGSTPVGPGCAATSFTVTNGYADNGKICGFAWTASFPEGDAAVTIDPPCALGDGTDCFMGADLCTTATVPASTAEPAYYPGVIIGWNAAQNSSGAANGNWTATGTGLTPTFTTTGTGEVRVVIKSGASEYCAPATSGSPIPWASFTVNCWEAGGAALSAGSQISQVMLQLNAGATAQTGVDFCLGGITVN